MSSPAPPGAPAGATPWSGAPDLQRMRARIDRLATEMSTGRAVDAGQALRGDFSRLSALRHNAARDAAHLDAMRLLSIWGEAGQGALTRMDAAVAGLGQRAVTLLEPDAADLGALAAEAEAALSDVLGAMGVQVAGRSVLADGAADAGLPRAADVLAAARAAAAPATGLADLDARMAAFVAPGGGFDALMAAAPRPAAALFPTGEGPDGADAVAFPLSHRSEGPREALRAVLVAATLPLAPAAGAEADAAGLQGHLLRARGALAEEAGRLGAAEARAGARIDALEAAALRAEAEESDLLEVDPAEAATRLRHEIDRLETAYALTARVGRLSLLEFLR